MTAGSHRLLLVTEGKTDERRTRWVLDAWVEYNGITQVLEIVGLTDGSLFLSFTTIVRDFQKAFPGPRYSGAVGKGDAGMVRRLSQLLDQNYKERVEQCSAILWVRDADDQGEKRANDARGSRDASHFSTPLVIGYACQCGEAWTITGVPKAGLTKAQGRWVQNAHTLSHKEKAPNSAKRVQQDLSPTEENREAHTRRATKSALEGSADRVGLRAFVEELNSRLLPVLGSAQPT